MVKYLHQLTLTTLILLQLVAPLLHVHSGIELNDHSLHIPGLEKVDNVLHLSDSVSQDEDFGIGVCVGINQINDFSDLDLDAPIIFLENRLTPYFQSVRKYLDLQINAPPPNQFILRYSPRAPPSLLT